MIRVNVNGQMLSACKCETLVSDSLNIIDIKFVFSEEWGGLTKTAQFHQVDGETKTLKTYNVLLDEADEAMLPNEIKAGVVLISVFGVSGTIRMTTSMLAIPVEKSGFVGDGETPIPPTPDLYQQLIARLEAGGQGGASFNGIVTALGFLPLSNDDVSFSQSDVKDGYARKHTIKVGEKEITIIMPPCEVSREDIKMCAPVITTTAAGDAISDAVGGRASSVVVALSPRLDNGMLAPNANGGSFVPLTAVNLNVNGEAFSQKVPNWAYAGSLDWVSGEMKLFRGRVVSVPVEGARLITSGTSSQGIKYIRFDPDTTSLLGALACNRYELDASGINRDKIIRIGTGNPYIYDNDIDLDNPLAILEGLEILLPDGTSEEILNIDGHSVELKPGANTITADSGHVTVSYGVDTKAYVDAKFAALSAALLGG